MTAPDTPATATTQPSSASSDRTRATIVRALSISAVGTAIAAVVLGIAAHPALFGLLLIAAVDLIIARLFASGRLGTGTDGDSAPPAQAEADPSYNPYARED